MTEFKRRDYRIGGEETEKAFAKGLVNAEWYILPIQRERLKKLLVRKDGPAIRDTMIWLAVLIGTGALAYLSWGSWLMIPTFLLYGNIYILTASSRLHECNHGTAFKTTWMNDSVFQLAACMLLLQTRDWSWSHPRHHTDTIIVGRDPEIVAPKPPFWKNLFPQMFLFRALYVLTRRSFGYLTPSEKEFWIDSDAQLTIWEARVYLVIHFGI